MLMIMPQSNTTHPASNNGWPGYDGPNGGDHARAIAVDELGNVYVTGDSEGPGVSTYATVKYNSDGQQQWVTNYTGPSNVGFAVAIALDGVGNVDVTGSSLDSGEIYTDYATIKYDSAGQEQWVMRYDGPGSGGDFAHALAVDGSGNVYVTGTSDDINLNEDYATVKYRTGSYSNANPVGHCESDCYIHGYADSYTDSESHANGNMCSNCDGYASTDALPNVYGYAQDDTDDPSRRQPPGDANSKPKRDPYGHT